MKKELQLLNQALLLLVIVFLGIKKGFDVLIYIAIILELLSIGLNIMVIKNGKKD